MNYKMLLIVPVALLVISLTGLALLVQSGFQRDIDLKGGTQISFDSAAPVDIKELENSLGKDVRVRTAKSLLGYSVLIETNIEKNSTEIVDALRRNGFEPSVQTVSPVLGGVFFTQAIFALCTAFVLMVLVVFVIFRKVLPSTYVVFAAAADIIETLVISQFIGIKLSLATFAALLLLIGYSVDTDILLTSRVLRGEGEAKEKIKGAMKTGLTMTGTTISAVIVLLFVSTSPVLTQIASVLLIGLVVDIINTWLNNAVLLRWYVEIGKKG